MKKRILCALLTLCMVLMLVPTTANATTLNEDSLSPESGWVKDNGNWYFLNEDGVKLTGWHSDIPGWEGKWFYFDLETGIMLTGWHSDIPGWEGKWFYFDLETGIMLTGWHSDIPDWEDNWFYFDLATGILQSSWLQDGGWYYYGEAGTIPADFTIENGYEDALTIGDEQILTIPEGVTITVNGTLTNRGILVINGTIVVQGSGELNNSGVIVIQGTGELSNSGSISNAGKIYVDGTFTGTADNLYYPLTLVNATAAENTSVYSAKTYGKAGSVISLTPNTPAGYAFDKWAVSPSSVTVDADNSFTMPRTPLAITAQWKDTDKPVITGLQNGKTYCGAVAFEASDNDGIASVKAGNTVLTVGSDGKYTLAAGVGTVTVAVTDHAGNTTELNVTVNSEHAYEWKDEGEQYWQQCKFCGYETAKKDIPTITIDGADAVCVTQDYKFSFTLPEGATNPVYSYTMKGTDPFQPAVIENNKPYGVVPATKYVSGKSSFVVTAGVTTADGFEISAAKTVALALGHIDEKPKDHNCDMCGERLSEHWGGTAACTTGPVCDYCKQEYGNALGHNYISTVMDEATQYKCENCGDEYWTDFKNSDSYAQTVMPNGETIYHYCTHKGLEADTTVDVGDGQTLKVFLQDPLIILKRMEEDGLKTYPMLDGAQQTIPFSSEKKISFRSEAAFEYFDQVSLDGLVLPEKYYSVTRGSTIVTLNADFVATLEPGIHLFGILSTDGIALTTFTVAEAASPQTGDTSHMALWIALFVVSGGLLTVTGIYGVRKKRSAR